jgi:CubicO group peptidase (beta-lactamase class C family)/peptidoglycan/LPS O-acetylase OafA/YrhL
MAGNTSTIAPATTGRREPGSGARDGFLDTVRAIAIVRVVLWHAFGAAAITYVVSAVPAMFFVTGSLLARSLDRKGIDATYGDRLRRLLVPFWAFGAVAVGIMVGIDRALDEPGTALPWSRMVWWILPLEDPPGSTWQAGWLNDPLWYLRAMLWVILLAPALVAVTRRARATSLVGAAVVVVLADLVGRDPSWLPADLVRLPWLVGDLALYGGFAMAGVAHRDGLLERVPRARWVGYAVLAAAATTGWVVTQPVEDWVVNHSQPAHLLVGAAWLCLAFAARDVLASVPDRPTLGPVVRLINQRSLTIYLWHAATIITAHQFLTRVVDGLPTGVFSLALLAMVACMTTAAVLAFGWIEDLAGRRTPRLWPGERTHVPRTGPTLGPALAFGAAGMVVLLAAGLVVTSPEPALAATRTSVTDSTAPGPARAALPAPSRQPSRVTFDTTATTAARYAGPRTAVFTAQTTTTAPTTPASSATTTAPAATTAPTTTTTTAPPAAVAIVPLAPDAPAALADTLQARLTSWTAEQGLSGASAGVARAGVLQWTGATGTRPDGAPVTTADTFPVHSVTKTFTGALVMREVARGTIELDAPLPALTAVPGFPASGTVTVRQLLDHSSGLVNYRDAPGYVADPAGATDAAATLRAIAADPPSFAAGTAHGYSSTNYLVLDVLLQQVTGRSFEDLIDGLFDEFGLAGTTHDDPVPGEPAGGTSGVRTDVTDLLRWATALLRDRAVFPAAQFDEYTVVDPASTIGPVWGYCPCTIGPDGARFRAIGQSGATTMLTYAVDDDLVVVIDVPTGLWDTPERHGAVAALGQELRDLVNAATGVTGA